MSLERVIYHVSQCPSLPLQPQYPFNTLQTHQRLCIEIKKTIRSQSLVPLSISDSPSSLFTLFSSSPIPSSYRVNSFFAPSPPGRRHVASTIQLTNQIRCDRSSSGQTVRSYRAIWLAGGHAADVKDVCKWPPPAACRRICYNSFCGDIWVFSVDSVNNGVAYFQKSIRVLETWMRKSITFIQILVRRIQISYFFYHYLSNNNSLKHGSTFFLFSCYHETLFYQRTKYT